MVVRMTAIARVFLLSIKFRPSLGPIQPLKRREVFHRAQRAERQADLSPPSSAEVKNV